MVPVSEQRYVARTLDLGVVLCLVLLALDGQLHAVARQEHLVGAGFLWEGVWMDEFLQDYIHPNTIILTENPHFSRG